SKDPRAHGRASAESGACAPSWCDESRTGATAGIVGACAEGNCPCDRQRYTSSAKDSTHSCASRYRKTHRRVEVVATEINSGRTTRRSQRLDAQSMSTQVLAVTA